MSLREGLPRLAGRLFDDLPRVTAAGRVDAAGVAIPILAAFLFTVSEFHGQPVHAPPPLVQAAGWCGPVAPHLWWFGTTALLLGLVPVGLLRLLGEPLDEYGLGPGRWRLGLGAAAALFALMLPVVLAAAGTPAFAGQYPLAPAAAHSRSLFAVYEAGYAGYFAGWELGFRSFLLFGLYRRVGLLAIPLQALPFALLHFGKPELEALGSVPAALALGWLALRTRSAWWGALLHAAVAFTMDLATAWTRLGG